VEVYGVIFTDGFANAAFFILQVQAVFMDISDQGDCLGEVDMHRFISRQILIVGVWNFYRAVLDANGATRAVIFYNVPGLLIQRDLEISRIPFDPVNFCISQYFNVWMPADLDQFG
jgi:hypothetical protein